MSDIIDIHADDYALSENSDSDILDLCLKGFLNSISIIPNLSCFENSAKKLLEIQSKLDKKILISLHLNFMEGVCCAKKEFLPNLVDANGFFIVSWGKLFLWNYTPFIRKKIKQQLKIEILEQVKKCIKAGIIERNSIRLDSHQHSHMIPIVFDALKEAILELEANGCEIKYIRNVQDPIVFYNAKNIFSINTIKCIILNFYSVNARKYFVAKNLKLNYLCGVYFSGQMDSRIQSAMLKFIKNAKKHSRFVELLFHPGTMLKSELTGEFQKQKFNQFHLSPNRKLEYFTLCELAKFKIWHILRHNKNDKSFKNE